VRNRLPTHQHPNRRAGRKPEHLIEYHSKGNDEQRRSQTGAGADATASRNARTKESPPLLRFDQWVDSIPYSISTTKYGRLVLVCNDET